MTITPLANKLGVSEKTARRRRNLAETLKERIVNTNYDERPEPESPGPIPPSRGAAASRG